MLPLFVSVNQYHEICVYLCKWIFHISLQRYIHRNNMTLILAVKLNTNGIKLQALLCKMYNHYCVCRIYSSVSICGCSPVRVLLWKRLWCISDAQLTCTWVAVNFFLLLWIMLHWSSLSTVERYSPENTPKKELLYLEIWVSSTLLVSNCSLNLFNQVQLQLQEYWRNCLLPVLSYSFG